MIFAPETMAMPRLTARAALEHRSEETMTRFLNDAATIHAILDAGLVAHVGFNLNGQPAVIPTLFGRAGNHLYLHVSPASMLQEIEEGVRACVTVTVVDGLVLARSAVHQFVNHRTVVAFGTVCKVDEPAKKAHALHVISDQLIQGRWQDVSAPSREELQATAVLEFLLEEAPRKLAKVSRWMKNRTTLRRSGPGFSRCSLRPGNRCRIREWPATTKCRNTSVATWTNGRAIGARAMRGNLSHWPGMAWLEMSQDKGCGPATKSKQRVAPGFPAGENRPGSTGIPDGHPYRGGPRPALRAAAVGAVAAAISTRKRAMPLSSARPSVTTMSSSRRMPSTPSRPGRS